MRRHSGFHFLFGSVSYLSDTGHNKPQGLALMADGVLERNIIMENKMKRKKIIRTFKGSGKVYKCLKSMIPLTYIHTHGKV